MKKYVLRTVSLLMSLLLLIGLTACATNRTPKEQFRDALKDAAQYVGGMVLPEKMKLPEIGDKGAALQASLKLNKMEVEGNNLLEALGQLGINVDGQEQGMDGKMTLTLQLGETSLPVEILIQGGKTVLVRFPDADEHYLAFAQGEEKDDKEQKDLQEVLKNVAAKLESMVTDETVTVETAEVAVAGETKKDGKKITLSLNEAQCKEILTDLKNLLKIGEDLDETVFEGFTLTVTFLTWKDQVQNVEAVLAKNGDKLTVSAELDRSSKTDAVLKGTVSASREENVEFALNIQGEKHPAEGGDALTWKLSLDGMPGSVEWKGLRSETDKSMENKGTLTVEISEEGEDVKFEIPVEVKAEVKDGAVSGSYLISVGQDDLDIALEVAGDFTVGGSKEALTIPEIADEQKIWLSDEDEENAEAMMDLLNKLGEKYPDLLDMIFGGLEF